MAPFHSSFLVLFFCSSCFLFAVLPTPDQLVDQKWYHFDDTNASAAGGSFFVSFSSPFNAS